MQTKTIQTGSAIALLIFGGCGGAMLWAEEPSVSISSVSVSSVPAILLLEIVPPNEGSSPGLKEEILDLWDAGKKRKAHRLNKNWIKKEKTSPEPWVTAGILRFKEEDYSKCLSYCQKALKLSSQNAGAYYWRGRAFDALGKPLEAANEYRAALIAEDDFSDARERLRRALSEMSGSSSDSHD